VRLVPLVALALVAPALQAQTDPHASLLAAARAAAEATSGCGLACGLGGAFAPDGYYLHNGAPIISGGDAARGFLLTQKVLAGIRVQWQALHAEVSADGRFGVTWGVTTIGIRGAPVRFGRYVSAWRRDDSGWRLVAHLQAGLNERSALPDGWAAPPIPPLSDDPASRAFVEADKAFAALASQTNAAQAFATYAATDAVTFAGTGELAMGPGAIRTNLEGGPPTDWHWGPVASGGAPDGSLGFTVGEATITPKGGTAFRSKYLTVWRRDSDGKVRFIADAGNAAP
jgi:ketosteroid isomerase-like protein